MASLPCRVTSAGPQSAAATDWHKLDAMTDADIARQIAVRPIR